jgi:hypothetical protein
MSGRRAATKIYFHSATRGSERMSNLWLILVPVILIVALILFFRLTKKS